MSFTEKNDEREHITAGVFSKIASEDKERRELDEKARNQKKKFPFGLRFVSFILVPFWMGCMGLLLAYVTRNGENRDMSVNFDRDFVSPFILTMAVMCVLAYQSDGFSTRDIKPLVLWPKVRRRKKIVRKTVYVDDDGKVVSERIEEDGGQVIQQGKSELRKED